MPRSKRPRRIFDAGCTNGFQEVCRTSDDLCQELSWEAQQELFHDPEFLRSNIAQLDRMIREEQARPDRGYSRLPQLIIQKLERMEALGLPREELQQVEREHRDLPNVRRRVISRLLEGKQYSEAASLLRESKELDRKWPGLVSGYSQELIGLYEETGQTEKLLDELQFQVFQCGQHDLAYVKKLKEQTSTSRWPELRERLLAGKTLPGDLREAFLAQEGALCAADGPGGRSGESPDPWIAGRTCSGPSFRSGCGTPTYSAWMHECVWPATGNSMPPRSPI